VHDSVDFIRGDAWAQGFAGYIQDLPSHTTRVTQSGISVEFVRRVDANIVVTGTIALLAFRHTRYVIGVVRLANAWRHGTTGTEQGGA
jgi:hypothetical protein